MNRSATVKSMVIAAGISIFALGASAGHAAGSNTRYLEACEAELQQHFGETRHVAVVNKRRTVEGTRVTLSARMDDDNTQFVHCWVPNGGTAADFHSGSNAVAATIEPIPVID